MSVVLPAWNEAGNLTRAIAGARAAVGRICEPGAIEIVVVDDGSTDSTADEAEAAGAVVYRHGSNRGYGAALRTGFERVAQPWVLLLDADNQFEPDQVVEFAERVEAGADLVVGRRVHRADGATRRLAGWTWNGLCRVLVGTTVADADCAFKLMRSDLLRRLDLECSGAAISAEILVKAGRAGAVIAEVPVRHRRRTAGQSSGLRVRVVLRGLRELWRLRGVARTPAND